MNTIINLIEKYKFQVMEWLLIGQFMLIVTLLIYITIKG